MSERNLSNQNSPQKYREAFVWSGHEILRIGDELVPFEDRGKGTRNESGLRQGSQKFCPANQLEANQVSLFSSKALLSRVTALQRQRRNRFSERTITKNEKNLEFESFSVRTRHESLSGNRRGAMLKSIVPRVRPARTSGSGSEINRKFLRFGVSLLLTSTHSGGCAFYCCFPDTFLTQFNGGR